MPNHCANDLKINGKLKDIKDFLEKVKGLDNEGEPILIDANALIPYPSEYAELDRKAREHQKKTGEFIKDGYNSGGYEWCIDNWGTKWGMYNFNDLKLGKTYALVQFDTAWSPPIPLIKKMGKLFPNLKFSLRYYEQGAGFQGILKIENGEVVQDETFEYLGLRGG